MAKTLNEIFSQMTPLKTEAGAQARIDKAITRLETANRDTSRIRTVVLKIEGGFVPAVLLFEADVAEFSSFFVYRNIGVTN